MTVSNPHPRSLSYCTAEDGIAADAPSIDNLTAARDGGAPGDNGIDGRAAGKDRLSAAVDRAEGRPANRLLTAGIDQAAADNTARRDQLQPGRAHDGAAGIAAGGDGQGAIAIHRRADGGPAGIAPSTPPCR